MQGVPLSDEPEEMYRNGTQQVHVSGMVYSHPSDEFHQAGHISLGDATPVGEEVLPRSVGDDAEVA